MSNVKLPKNLNPESLYLYCELTAFNDAGDKIDFTGLKTYSIGFMKENLGFGITDIGIEISPSMQPIIEITFKDFYGNLTFGFSENKKVIEDAAGRSEIGELDFSSMFDLPYPKFKLTIKGYLGHPVVLELNVRKINVSLIPTDGSYEIKALFVPNLYGFFADMPYYFLKAVKSLRLEGANVSDRALIEKNYLSAWDVALLGEEIQQEIQTIEDSFGEISVIIDAILNSRDKMFDIDWFKEPAIEGKSNSGTIIPGFENIFFNIEPLVNGKIDRNLKDVKNGEKIRKSLKNSIGPSNGVPGKEIVRRALIASITTTSGGKKYNILTSPPEEDIRRGTAILERNQKALDDFRNLQLTKGKGKETKIKNVTIKNIFDLLIKDSAFLMGKILEAGQKGFNNDPSRKHSKTKFGNYFPLINDSNTHEQIPDPTAYEENKFVQNFVKALTTGIVSDLNKGIENNNAQGLNQVSVVGKRINNLEVLSTNPYDTTNVDSFIESLLLRSGIAVSMLDEATGMSYEFQLNSWISPFNNANLEKFIKNELDNLDAGLKKISSSSNRFALLHFCNFITKIFDSNGRLKDNSGNIVNLNQPINGILDLKYTFGDDPGQIPMRQILNRYLPSRTGVNTGSYKAYALTHNGLPYFSRIKNRSDILYVIFKEPTNTPTVGNLSNANDESTQAFPSDRFIIDEVKDIKDDIKMGAESDKTIVKLIQEKRLIDYEKLTSNNSVNAQSILADNVDIYFKGVTTNPDPNFTALNAKLKSKKYYVGVFTTGSNDAVWNLFGTDDVWVNQRKVLYELCKALKSKIVVNEEESKEKVQETIEKLESQYNIFYTQFHHICNNWKNLLAIKNLNGSQNIASELESMYTNNGYGRVIYQIPLQEVQNTKGKVYNLENAIVNPKPLTDNNSQTTVLNIMASLCHLNNFMFISVPGNGLDDKNIQEVFTPYDKPVKTDSLPVNNFFYVMFMPTPENRVSYNNRDPLYQTFNVQLEKQVFEIDFGSPDNTIIKSINLTTEDNKVTAESAIAISNLVDGPNSRKVKNLDCSALSIMEGRSYRLNGEMIGNAQIVPTQFFVVNRAPIFNGLYQIMKVKHRITPNNMTTSFEAIKMKFAGSNSEFVFVPPITLESLGVPVENKPTVQNSPPTTNNENFDSKDLKNSLNGHHEKYLKELHPAAQEIFRNFINLIQSQTDYAVVINSGYRSFARQSSIKYDRSDPDYDPQAATPGLSHHNYGMALDIKLQNGTITLSKRNTTKKAWEATGVVDIAKKLNLRWGGNFGGYNDYVHFDLGNQYITSDLLAKAKLQFGDDNSRIQGNKVQLA